MTSKAAEFLEGIERYYTIYALAPYTGDTVARLIDRLGYKDLFSLSETNPLNIYYAPFIGKTRFEQILKCLHDYGLDFDYSTAGPAGTARKPVAPPTPVHQEDVLPLLEYIALREREGIDTP